MFGNEKYCEFYKPFLLKNGIEPVVPELVKQGDDKGTEFGLLFPKEDVHTTQDLIKEIKIKYGGKLKLLPIVEKISYSILDDLFLLDVERICFEFNPEKVMEELKRFIEMNSLKSNTDSKKKPYVINFYESIGTFFIDISGELVKEKLLPLKLMFTNYLSNKISKLKGVVYIFNNADEDTITFNTIWALFRIWKEIGIDYNNISFLTASQDIVRRLNKYIGHLGVKHYADLLEIVKKIYPEIAKNDEMAIFEFASSLLQTENKKASA